MEKMDALTHILKTIGLSAKTYFCEGLSGPWNMQFQYRPEGIFHIVLQGQCYLREGGQKESILLQEGDAVAFPTGGAHWISDTPDSQNLPSENVVTVSGDEDLLLLKNGDVRAFTSNDYSSETPNETPGSDTSTVLFCTTLSYDASLKHPFLRSLPCFIHVGPRTNDERRTLKLLTGLLAEESASSYPGKSLMVNNLSEVLFIQMLRSHIREAQRPSGYMAALADQNIGQALNLIHTEAEKKWSVESLSRAVAMSGTTFTRRFAELVGVTPKAYLTNTRLLKARIKLQSTAESTLSIAESAGYASEAAFSKAFKKHFNTTPGELRKRYQRVR
ncbi:AraC family transcriptional regulator [Halioglobus japonicus]|nr:AraC family transcriptional regulator [Halioglobus japonicus]GHD18987.1 AraC family transcriptional regulator [Halioglobus japonicus]